MKRFSLLILPLLILFVSCDNSEEPQPVGIIDLDIDIDYYLIHGLYEVGVPLDSSNYITVKIRANEWGPYSIRTVEVNGFRFEGSGDLSKTTLTDQIKLYGIGTPKSEQLARFELKTNSENEYYNTEEIEVYSFENLDDQVLIASGDLIEGDSDYTDFTMALSERGEVIWKIEGESSFAVIDNDIVYINHSTALMAVNISDGSIVWSKPELAGAASISLNGTHLYVASKKGKYYAIETSTQSELWSFTPVVEDYPFSAPVFDNDNVYVEDNGNIRALNQSDGSIVWSSTFEKLYGTPVISENSLIAGGESAIKSINLTTGSDIWLKNESTLGSLLLVNNAVYYFTYFNEIRGRNIDLGESQFYYDGGAGDFELGRDPINYGDTILVLQVRFPGLNAFYANSMIWGSGSPGYANPIIQGDIIYENGFYHDAETGKVLMRLQNQTDYRVNIYELMAIKNIETGEVSYPTRSAMD